MFAQNRHVCTMIHLELLGTLQGSRNTSAGNMVRRNGSAKNAQKSMQFDLIGKLTPRSVAPESTDVTVEPFSQGKKKGLLLDQINLHN